MDDDDGFKDLPFGCRVIDSGPSDAARAASRQSPPDPDRWRDSSVYPTRAVQDDPKGPRASASWTTAKEGQAMNPDRVAKVDRRYIDADRPRELDLDDLYREVRGPVAEGVGRDGEGWLPEIGVPSRNRLPPASGRELGVKDAPENFPTRAPDAQPGPAARAIQRGLDWLAQKAREIRGKGDE
jgi:hypothetical protein